MDYCRPRTKHRYCSTLAHNETQCCRFYDFYPCLCAINKRNMNFISQRIRASISPARDCDVKEGTCEYFLLELFVKLPVKLFLFGKQERAAHLNSTYVLEATSMSGAPRLSCMVAVNPPLVTVSPSVSPAVLHIWVFC